MKELPRGKSRILRIKAKNEEQIMDRNNGLEAKVSKEETRTTIMMDSGELPPPNIKVSLQGQSLHMGTIVRTTEDHMISSQNTHSIETMEIDLVMELLTTRIGTGETMHISRLPSIQRGDFSQSSSYCQPRSDQANSSAFRRLDN